MRACVRACAFLRGSETERQSHTQEETDTVKERERESRERDVGLPRDMGH